MNKTIRPFTDQGKFTTFDNYILDYIMPKVKPSAWKCLCFIIRKTVGWHKESDTLSFSQIRQGTGIASDQTIAKALAELEQENYIVVQRFDDQWTGNKYRLNTALEIVVEESPTTETVAEPTTESVAVSTTESVDTKEKEKKENKENLSEKSKRDPVADMLKAKGKVSESTAPNPDDQWLNYRDKALEIYDRLSGAWGSTAQERETRRGLILGGVASRDSFDPDRWERSIMQSIGRGVGAGNIARFWEVYDAGGDYGKFLGLKYPSANGSMPANPGGKIKRAQDGGLYV